MIDGYFVPAFQTVTGHRGAGQICQMVAIGIRRWRFRRFSITSFLLCALPIDFVERALVNNNREAILILDLSWTTSMSLLF
jgi:hypothetical protein